MKLSFDLALLSFRSLNSQICAKLMESILKLRNIMLKLDEEGSLYFTKPWILASPYVIQTNRKGERFEGLVIFFYLVRRKRQMNRWSRSKKEALIRGDVLHLVYKRARSDVAPWRAGSPKYR